MLKDFDYPPPLWQNLTAYKDGDLFEISENDVLLLTDTFKQINDHDLDLLLKVK